MVNKAFRFELKPTKQQLPLLAQHAGIRRKAWNWSLERVKDREIRANGPELHKAWNQWKKENAPYSSLSSKCAPQEAFSDLADAFESHWNNKEKFGYPNVKRKKCAKDTFRFNDPEKIGFMGRHVKLPVLGRVRIKEKNDKLVPGEVNGIFYVKGAIKDKDGKDKEIRRPVRILNATVNREADRWFVSLAVATDIKEPKPVEGPMCGIDVGLTIFAMMFNADGTVDDPEYAPKPLKRYLKKLVRQQRKFSRRLIRTEEDGTKRSSKNREKQRMIVARLHRRIRNIRSDFLHKLSTRLAKTKSVIKVEGLSVKNMMKNKKLARHIADVAWGTFISMLKYKCGWYGSTLCVADRWFASTKTCSCCGNIKDEMPLEERVYRCEKCGLEMDRDENAAKNICFADIKPFKYVPKKPRKKKGYKKNTASYAEINACGDCVRPEETGGGRPCKKQEENLTNSNIC